VGEAAGFLGVQLKMPFEDAAEFAAKMQDATKTTEQDMLSLMDVIQKSFYLGVDSTNMLQGFSKISAGMKTIKAQGLEGAKAMAPLLVMADQAAMAGESAGNAYSKIFKAMMDTDKIKDSLSDLQKSKGINLALNFTNGKGEFGGLNNMFKELEKLKGMSTEARIPILGDMFGSDSETMQALNLLIDKGQDGYNQTIAKMDAQANLQKRVNTQLGTLKNLWDSATGTFTNSMASFGEAIAPELKMLVDWIGNVSESMGQFAQENPVLSNTLMKLGGAIIFILAVVAILSGVLLAILGPIAAVRMAFIMLNLSMAVNPIFLIILALVALAAIIYTNWDAIVQFWQGLGSGTELLKAFGLLIIDSLLLPFRLVIGAVNLLIDGLNRIPGINLPKVPQIKSFLTAEAVDAALAGGKTRAAAANTPALKAANVPALKGNVSSNKTVTNHFAAAPIIINGATDPKAVGAEVKRQMDANQRQQASRDRSALADKD